jgi:hypothetical protein
MQAKAVKYSRENTAGPAVAKIMDTHIELVRAAAAESVSIPACDVMLFDQ